MLKFNARLKNDILFIVPQLHNSTVVLYEVDCEWKDTQIAIQKSGKICGKNGKIYRKSTNLTEQADSPLTESVQICVS